MSPAGGAAGTAYQGARAGNRVTSRGGGCQPMLDSTVSHSVAMGPSGRRGPATWGGPNVGGAARLRLAASTRLISPGSVVAALWSATCTEAWAAGGVTAAEAVSPGDEGSATGGVATGDGAVCAGGAVDPAGSSRAGVSGIVSTAASLSATSLETTFGGEGGRFPAVVGRSAVVSGAAVTSSST